MKLSALAISLLFSTSAFAAKSGVYCENNGRIYNAASEDGHFQCAGALAQGDACFTGKRSEVIELINNDTFNWDEEWLESAHYQGKDAIAYLFVDGPNELQDKVSINRCTADFFRK